MSTSTKKWTELFSNDYNSIKKTNLSQENEFVSLIDSLNSTSNGIYFTEKIPRSIIKKSINNLNIK